MFAYLSFILKINRFEIDTEPANDKGKSAEYWSESYQIAGELERLPLATKLGELTF
jgi:hypothetical protein